MRRARLWLRRAAVTLPRLPAAERVYRGTRQGFDEMALTTTLERCRQHGGREKYLDVGRFLRRAAMRAVLLGLHREPPRRILDLGCGSGYFLAVCRHLGHSVHGVDLDKFPVFNELVAFLDVPRTVHAVTAGKPLPPSLAGPWDLVTAFWIAFDRHFDDDGMRRWTAADWRGLLADLRPRLAETGRIYLRFNFRLGDFPEVAQLFAAPPGYRSRVIDDGNVELRR